MRKKTKIVTSPFAYASPWILATAIGMLIGIVIFFAVNNLQREKRIMTESLFNKGQAIIRFIGAGTRASMMMMGSPNTQQFQHLIEQAAGESNIIYIAVANSEGKIVAHSTPTRVGTTFDHPLPGETELPPVGKYQIINVQGTKQKVFEIVAPFKPFMRGGGYFFKRHRQAMLQGEKRPPPHQMEGNPASCQFPPGAGTWLPGENLAIIVGLDMTEQDKIIQQDRFHMLYMSVALLLVAIGGWIALLTAQSYRSSQKTLMNMQAFTDLLISRLPVGIIATNAEGYIQTFNSTAARFTGKPPEQTIGQLQASALPQIQQLFPPEEHVGEVIDREILLPPDSSAPYHLQISSVPITDGQGNTIGKVMLMYDLTEIKKLEAQVRRHDRLVSLGKMAAGVAHEVRNPLSSIKGFATLLGSRFPTASEEGEAARLLIDEVERLNRSITELLTYARPLPLAIAEVEIEPFIEASLKLIQSDAKELGVAVHHEIALKRKQVRLDKDRLNQVLLNLYLNSLQAMEHGGELQVSAHAGTRPGTVEISVRDTGCGIAEDIMERVMDPYFTTKAEGTGLGLAMVYKIIDEHGGTIRIASKKGEGTTVTIILPG
ncbi:ATP-binding protein [Thiovibrio frasassiensis]|uniref:histidine kinase n=1 Tax=Thiovibrio frasassiensis TaxID=2984131 RepID=A0A9X4RM91_9BACT|nr:ATP-binding protein [Thiovibrio frasassiensis]MDG4476544.1 ATP-binding protein [Thiovibrio frasassiensis]